MSLFESMAANTIFIDFSRDPVFGSDQVYLCVPSQFPTVTFALYATIPLCRAADQIRKETGHPPMLPTEEDEAGDNCVWYDFSIGINGFSSTNLDSVIAFVVCETLEPDEGEEYHIDLTEEERAAIYRLLDQQCQKYLKKGCADLLNEARERMETEEQDFKKNEE